MSDAVIAACRARWPRHTAKRMAQKWGRAVVTTKLWLTKGVPAYQLHTILADLDDELTASIEELTELHASLRRARLAKKITRGAHLRRAGAGESAPALRPIPEGRE